MSSEQAQERFPYPVETPELVETQRTALHNLGRLLIDSHADVDDDILRAADSWRSDTAYTAISDVRSLSSSMRGDSDAIAPAIPAMTAYIGRIEHARTRIDGIRDRYDQAGADRDTANADPPDWADNTFLREEYRSGNQAAHQAAVDQLDAEYTDVKADLTADSRPAVTALHEALDVLAPPGLRSIGTLDQVSYGAASDDLALTGNHYELLLREQGLLTGPTPGGQYTEWLENAERQSVSPAEIAAIASQHGITPEDFEILDGLEEVSDGDGKSFFLLPDDISGDDARKAVLMTYILNAGTDYGTADDDRDYEPTPYSTTEVQRIIDRQAENAWSYDDDVAFVHENGGRLATTPNGIIMGLGGDMLQDLYSFAGGTTYGDIFMFNIDDTDEADAVLRDIVRSGGATYQDDDGQIYQSDLDLDRLLHHEEIHSQQYAALGLGLFVSAYLAEQALAALPFTPENYYERDAGLTDGGYH